MSSARVFMLALVAVAAVACQSGDVPPEPERLVPRRAAVGPPTPLRAVTERRAEPPAPAADSHGSGSCCGASDCRQAGGGCGCRARGVRCGG